MKMPDFRKPWLLLAVFWLLGAVGLLVASLMTDAFTPGLVGDLYFAAVTLFSPLALAAFGWDKWKAGRDGRRIPEKTLLILALVGGWPGAIAGQQWFRHKTIKPVFRSILVAIAALHVAAVGFVVYRSFQGS
mgnify:CR=1 FL=1